MFWMHMMPLGDFLISRYFPFSAGCLKFLDIPQIFLQNFPVFEELFWDSPISFW